MFLEMFFKESVLVQYDFNSYSHKFDFCHVSVGFMRSPSVSSLSGGLLEKLCLHFISRPVLQAEALE